ncbi:hypothetical protein [uncultured Rothia sp.]
MANNSNNSVTPLWVKIVSVLYFVALVLLVFILLVIAILLIVLIAPFDSHQWSVIGDVSRNTSGWVALFAAAGTITAMHITNRSREKEAASSNFRDHLQWAVERAADNENQFEVAFAQAVIQHFANNKPKHLSNEEHELVLEVRQTLENMQVIEDQPATEDSQ